MYIPFLSIILHPDYTDLNLYSYTLNGFSFEAFLSIAVINTAVNKYFRGMLGGVGNNSNTVIIYLFLHAGTKFSNRRIFFLLPLFL